MRKIKLRIENCVSELNNHIFIFSNIFFRAKNCFSKRLRLHIFNNNFYIFNLEKINIIPRRNIFFVQQNHNFLNFPQRNIFKNIIDSRFSIDWNHQIIHSRKKCILRLSSRWDYESICHYPCNLLNNQSTNFDGKNCIHQVPK